jgi:glycosyltransferase involved in cell wall biosynthesis
MKILCVNSVFSEFGGVEFAAFNLAEQLARRGHDVHFLSAEGANAALKPKQGAAERKSPVQSHKRSFPRIYPLGEKHGVVRKLIWHLQDLGHPENERQFSSVLTEVNPDICLLHNITAIGLNIWRTLAATGTPTVQVVHDQGLVCMNMSRYRGGRQCNGLCLPCRAQKLVRFAIINGKQNFSFVSPARATLDITQRFADMDQWERAVIPNANPFRVEPRRNRGGSPANILFVGRVDASKGIDVALRAVQSVAERVPLVFHVLGTGPQEQQLRQEYADRPWVNFHGSVSQEQVAEFMADASILLVPSQWEECAPTVAVHALHAGLPVLASRIGGLPELVFEGITGSLVDARDERAWADAIFAAVTNPRRLRDWSIASVEKSALFSASAATDAYEKFMLRQIDKQAAARRVSTAVART